MRIKDTIEKIPGGLMVVPLLLGAFINTIDQLHLKPIMNLLKSLGAPKLKKATMKCCKLVDFHKNYLKIAHLS
mgnify:CR=1 FL=1